MEDFKNRILEYIESQLGISQREFEKRCGLAQGTIPSIRVKGPSVDVWMKISNTYPDLNLNWLVAGRGAMLMQEHVSGAPQNDIHHNQQVVIANWEGLKDVLEEVIKEKCQKSANVL